MTDVITTRIQSQPFDMAAECALLAERCGEAGAIASFVGIVRGEGGLRDLTLEHYPGMTETGIAELARNAEARFPLQAGLVIHRYGTLTPGDAIVLVLAASRHRQAALDAVAFLIDHLKTEAVFWKRERYLDGTVRWVEAYESDDARVAKWKN